MTRLPIARVKQALRSLVNELLQSIYQQHACSEPKLEVFKVKNSNRDLVKASFLRRLVTEADLQPLEDAATVQREFDYLNRLVHVRVAQARSIALSIGEAPDLEASLNECASQYASIVPIRNFETTRRPQASADRKRNLLTAMQTPAKCRCQLF